MLKNRRAPGPTISKAPRLEPVSFPALRAVGVREPPRLPGHPWGGHTKTLCIYGAVSGAQEKVRHFCKRQIKISNISSLPPFFLSRAQCRYHRQSLGTVTDFTIEFASDRLHYLLKV